MIKILFVCTGNVFRSMIAEKCLNNYLIKNNIKEFEVDSAGIDPIPQKPQKATIERLSFYNIKINHKYKKINQNLVDNNDIIIAMNINHQKYIKEKFGFDAPLFNELISNNKEGILDFEEYDPNIIDLNDKKKKKEIQKYAYFLVDYVYNSIPKLMANIHKWV